MKSNSVPFRLATCAVAVALGATSALALEPKVLRVGSVLDVVPSVDTSVTHTDNMFLSNSNEVSSNIVQVTPRVTARITDGLQLFETTLEIFSGNYSATEEDDYTDWKLAGIADLEINVRNKLRFDVEHFNTHEVRGTGFSQGDVFTPVPDKFDATTLAARYQFGTDSSRGRIVMDANRYEKDYTNNELTTFMRNRVDTGWSGTFYLGTLPSTDILFQYRFKDVDYVNDPAAVAGFGDSLDSEEQYAYIGATWEATAKTTGSVKFGYGTKEFADADRGDSSGPSWEAILRWEPRTYSIVNLTAGRAFGEPSGIGSGLDSRSYSLNWEHQWSGRFKSTLVASRSDDSYIDSIREDRISGYSARVDYAFDTWLDVFVFAGYDERQSELTAFNYDQNIFRLGFAASL